MENVLLALEEQFKQSICPVQVRGEGEEPDSDGCSQRAVDMGAPAVRDLCQVTARLDLSSVRRW